MNTMDSIVLSTCAGCCTIQLLCHMISTPQFPLQLSPYDPLSSLYRRYMTDRDSECLQFLCQELLQMVVYQVFRLSEDH